MVLAYCIIFACWLLTKVRSATLCPVSLSYSAKPHVHGYPVSIFYRHNKTVSRAYNCNIVNDADPNPTPIQLCDDHSSLCPVKVQNVRSALSVAPWPQYVDAFTRLGKEANINVFYLGGSMTLGAETWLKCLCSVTEDSRCPAAVFSPNVCGWVGHMSHWLQHTYPHTKFHFHDYSVGGRTSQSSDYFIDVVRTSKANLSNPALFFLDYSVNDVQAQEFSGLETFMRTIIGHFGVHYHIKPTIVVIEQYPHTAFRAPPMYTAQDYAVAYRRISQHYNAVLISLREVFWTYFGEPNGRNITNPNLAQRYYPISPFDPNVHVWVHPPWFLHLYIADVLAECFLRITAQFQSNNTSIHANTIDSTLLLPRRARANVSYVPVSNALPPPLFDVVPEMQRVCNLSFPYVVDATPPPTTYSGGPNATLGWTLTKQHSALGWLINNHADPDKRILSFPIPITAAIVQGQGLIVKLTFLKSYEGMGAAHLQLCGQPLTETTIIDALWTDPVSCPVIKSFVLSSQDIARCQTVPQIHRTVGLVYSPGLDQPELRAKHHNQFKLFDVRVCVPITV